MRIIFILIFNFSLLGCTLNNGEGAKTVDNLNLNRFMGKWFVIASKPSFIEKSHLDPIEIYTLRDDGKIDIHYSYLKEGSHEREKINQLGIPLNKSNSEWMIKILWPFQSKFLVIELDENYQYTVITVPSKDLIWIMNRSRIMDETLLNKIVSKLKDKGFNVSEIKKVKRGN